MKLFLSSISIGGNLTTEFAQLIGKTPNDTKLALIENASDVYAEDNKGWVYENRALFIGAGYSVEVIDLRDYPNDGERLKAELSEYDAIWINGGNTFYLNWILRDTKAFGVTYDLVKAGMVYGGGSAGAIIAGPTLKYTDGMDDPEAAPKIYLEGMRMTETVVVPHLDHEKYRDSAAIVQSALRSDGFEVIGISDDQAVIIKDGASRIVSR